LVVLAKQRVRNYDLGMRIDSTALPDDIAALKRIIGELTRDAVAARAEIEKLRFQLARFKRALAGLDLGIDRSDIVKLDIM
jgi:hypothetical protein